MSHHIARIKGLGFIFWHAKHEFMHALLGIIWAWALREIWGEFRLYWFFLAVFGSVLPDIEHFVYFFTYGKSDEYSQAIRKFLREKRWRVLTTYIETGHKYNTNLSYHNIYVIGILGVAISIFWFFEWQSWFIMIGAMMIHYVFDIFDDIVTLGYINPNWKRWGNGRKKKKK